MGQVLKKTGRDRSTPSTAVCLQDGRIAPLGTLTARNYNPSQAAKAKRNYRRLGLSECLWDIESDKATGWGKGEAWHGYLNVDLSLGATPEDC